MPFAVTTMRSEGGALRIACATGVEAGAAVEAGAGLPRPAAGFAAAVALTGVAGLPAAGFAVLFTATGFVAGFFSVNFGFSTFFGFAGFAAARLVGIVGRSRPRHGGAGLQDAGLYRRVFACTAGL